VRSSTQGAKAPPETGYPCMEQIHA